MGVKVDDLVLAYHGDVIYDAKVLKIDHGQGVIEQDAQAKPMKPTPATQYFVHYTGWNSKWDEWVAVNRVLEVTPANRQLQKEAKIAAKSKKSTGGQKKKRIRTGGIDPKELKKSPFKKLKRYVDNDTEELADENGSGIGAAPGKQVTIQMPFALKKQLVEDWKQITQEPYKLVPLPRKPSVSQILKTYLDFKKSKVREGDAADEKDYKNVEGIIEGIQTYFDRALGSILLYRMERKQYQEIKKKFEDKPLSEIYGAEHLARLFVRLPVLLSSANMNDRERAQIQSRLSDFLKFLQKNFASWFLSQYEPATSKQIDPSLKKDKAVETAAASSATASVSS